MKINLPCAGKHPAFTLLLNRVMGLVRQVVGQGPQIAPVPKGLKLGNGGLWRMNGREELRQIECREGKIWITQTGCLTDIVLTSGQKQSVCGKGLVLVQALANSELVVK
jgi:hypothetical protein